MAQINIALSDRERPACEQLRNGIALGVLRCSDIYGNFINQDAKQTGAACERSLHPRGSCCARD